MIPGRISPTDASSLSDVVNKIECQPSVCAYNATGWVGGGVQWAAAIHDYVHYNIDLVNTDPLKAIAIGFRPSVMSQGNTTEQVVNIDECMRTPLQGTCDVKCNAETRYFGSQVTYTCEK